MLDDSDGDDLPHVTHDEAAESLEVGEGLDAQRLGGDHPHDAGVAGLDEIRVALQFFASAFVHLFLDLCKLAGDVSSVTVDHGRVPVANLVGVVHDDDLRDT